LRRLAVSIEKTQSEDLHSAVLHKKRIEVICWFRHFPDLLENNLTKLVTIGSRIIARASRVEGHIAALSDVPVDDRSNFFASFSCR
jgi:hypothetical protein